MGRERSPQVRRFNRTVTAAGRRAQRPLPGARPAARRGAAAVGDRGRGLRAADAARAARARLRLPEPAAAVLDAAGLVVRRRRATRDRRVRIVAPDRGGRRRARAARPPQRRAGRSRSSSRSTSRSGRGSSRAMATVERLLTAALVEIAAVDPAAAATPAAASRRTSPSSTAVRTRLRPGAERPAPIRDELRPPAGAVPARDPAGRARGLRRAEAPRRRADRDQAHVGRPLGARARRGPAPAHRARGAAPRDAARTVRLDTNRHARRGDRHVPLAPATGGRRLQRRAVRRTTGSRSAWLTSPSPSPSAISTVSIALSSRTRMTVGLTSTSRRAAALLHPALGGGERGQPRSSP